MWEERRSKDGGYVQEVRDKEIERKGVKRGK